MARHIKTKIRSDSLSLQPASSAPAARRDRATKRRVFHRKKVVQLSRNNHCHAILKSVFFFLRCLLFSPLTMIHAAWYFPHSHFFHQNDVWESTRNGGGWAEQNVDAPFVPLPSLFFLSLEISNYSDFFPSLMLQPRHARQLFLIKLFSLPSVDPTAETRNAGVN